MRQQGLTLPELLVALIVLAITLNLAIPSYTDLRQRDQLRVAALDFYQFIQLTRTHAVSRNRRVTMTHTGNWDKGWEIYEDSNNNGQRDVEEPIIMEKEGLNKVQVVANKYVKNYLSFTGSGEARLQSNNSKGAFQAGTFHICHPNQLNTSFQLTLSKGGRVNMDRIAEHSCSSN